MESRHLDAFKIARRFAQAGQSYDEHAVIQKKIAKHLMGLLATYISQDPAKRILEIGCGSGNLTNFFIESQHHQFDTYFLNDLYEEVKHHFCTEFKNSDRIQWCIGNAENIDFPNQLNLVISSSAIQWMQDLDGLFNKVYQSLNPQGLFCFSSFGNKNLNEIKVLTDRGLSYYEMEQVQQKLEQQGFELLHISEGIETLNFLHPKHVLQHLKATGVTATGDKFRWTKQSLETFYQGYRQFITTDEHENLVYPLSYHPIYVIARRIV